MFLYEYTIYTNIYLHMHVYFYICTYMYMHTCICAEAEETKLSWGLAAKYTAVIIWPLLFPSWRKVKVSGAEGKERSISDNDSTDHNSCTQHLAHPVLRLYELLLISYCLGSVSILISERWGSRHRRKCKKETEIISRIYLAYSFLCTVFSWLVQQTDEKVDWQNYNLR